MIVRIRGPVLIVAVPLAVLLRFVPPILGQFEEGTAQYNEELREQKASLGELVQSHPDTNLFFFPERRLPSIDNYTFFFPESADYRIGIDVDPCRYNSYNCCLNVFGSTEYGSLLTSGLEQERVFKYNVLAKEEDVRTNFILVYEDGDNVEATESRWADDEAVHDLECVGLKNPHDYCRGRNYALQRSPLRPPCVDNNSSLNTLAGCQDPIDGTSMEKCVQIGYSQNTFIPQCKEGSGDHCGTFLEVHMAHGTPYQDELDVIAEVQLDQRNVSGFYTTTMPLTWMKNDSKVLCAYTESFLRIGTEVYIENTAPVCCCPPPFLPDTRVGSFQCPRGARGDGAFGYESKGIADTLLLDTLHLNYPFCPIEISSREDLMMCSVLDVHDRRHYTRNCSRVEQADVRIARSYTSEDVQDVYDGVCPYFDSCALTTDGTGLCRQSDLRLSFIGQTGIVTALDNEAVIPQVWVTFNDNRTSYQFNQRDVKLETNVKSMYEIWWVVRAPSGFTVQKRKGFNVTEPLCTYDTTNDRFFPYAILEDGVPLDSSILP